MRRYRTHVVHLTVLATFASVLVPVRLSDASCNLIPSATTTFRGALGGTDRPFASPGEFVEVRFAVDTAGNIVLPVDWRGCW